MIVDGPNKTSWFQGSIKLFPADHMICWISILVQKEVMPKKKVFAARNLKDCLPSLPLKTR